LLALLALPADVALAQYSKSVRLLQSLYVAVPVAGVLALIALAAARRDRFVRARSVQGGNGGWAARLAWAGVYAAVTGGVALAVYGGLRAAQ
jgi:glucose dehydrogenase